MAIVRFNTLCAAAVEQAIRDRIDDELVNHDLLERLMPDDELVRKPARPLVGIEGGVVSGVINLESLGVRAPVVVSVLYGPPRFQSILSVL